MCTSNLTPHDARHSTYSTRKFIMGRHLWLRCHVGHQHPWVQVLSPLLIQLLANTYPRRQQMMAECSWRVCATHVGDLEWVPGSRILALASVWPNPGYYDYLGSKPADGRWINQSISAFQINKFTKKKCLIFYFLHPRLEEDKKKVIDFISERK